MANRYWVAIIGPVPDELIPDGGDDPRLAAKQAVESLTGSHDIPCNTSWVSEEVFQRIMDAKYRLPEAGG